MVEFIQSLNLEKILINVFSGTPEIFTAIAIMVILGMAAFFRMTYMITFLMIGIFLLMFAGYIDSSLFVLLGIVGALLIGFFLAGKFGK